MQQKAGESAGCESGGQSRRTGYWKCGIQCRKIGSRIFHQRNQTLLHFDYADGGHQKSQS